MIQTLTFTDSIDGVELIEEDEIRRREDSEERDRESWYLEGFFPSGIIHNAEKPYDDLSYHFDPLGEFYESPSECPLYDPAKLLRGNHPYHWWIFSPGDETTEEEMIQYMTTEVDRYLVSIGAPPQKLREQRAFAKGWFDQCSEDRANDPLDWLNPPQSGKVWDSIRIYLNYISQTEHAYFAAWLLAPVRLLLVSGDDLPTPLLRAFHEFVRVIYKIGKLSAKVSRVSSLPAMRPRRPSADSGHEG